MKINYCSLIEIKKKEKVYIHEIQEKEELKRRLLELGLVKNTEIQVIRIAPFHEEMVIMIRHFQLCLPKRILKNIIVERHL